MPEKTIPDEHHVVRHCPRNRTIRNDGVVIGVFPQLFELRIHRNEEYLSCSYFEYFSGSKFHKLRQCIAATPRNISDKDCMVLLNVGKTREIAASQGARVRIVHETKHKTNPAYAKIKGVPFDPRSAVLVMLSKAAVDCIHGVSEIHENGKLEP